MSGVPKDVDNRAKTKCKMREARSQSLAQFSKLYSLFMKKKKKNSKKVLKVDSILKVLYDFINEL